METYHGLVRTPADAIKLFEACRIGLLPRVQRRLSEKERQSIRSGSVYVWDEREAGMRRWTDGKSWSASRVSGSFLTYREMEGKRVTGFGGARRGAGKTPDSGRGSDEDQDDGEPDGYRYKADGLMKQSFSITTSTGQHLHLISYYSRPQVGQPDLMQPTNDPNLRHIVPLKGMYPESSLNEAPAMTRAPMQSAYAPSQHQPPHHGYPPQHVQQPNYSWPPSPVATPPYSHGRYTTHPPYGSAQLPPPHSYSQALSYHAAAQSTHYDRAPLPPPQQNLALAAKTCSPLPQPAATHPAYMPPPIHHSPHLSHARMAEKESPRLQHLQAQAREAVLIDPRLNGSRLPPLAQHSTVRTSPPSRGLSVSPPRSSHSDPTGMVGPAGQPSGGHKTSISALLHHMPSSSEANSAKPCSNSANSSPRLIAGAAVNVAAVAGQKRALAATEDARALGVLDKKFCL